MSNIALDWAFALPITGARKSVLVALANRANDATECWPSLAGIALHAGTTERGAQKALRELEQLGLIRTDRAPGKKSVYRLAVGAPTPERGSPHAGASPPNDVHPTPEPSSPPPPNVVPKPPNDVHPNPKKPKVQPKGNPQGSARASTTSGELALDGEAAKAAPASPRRTRARPRKPETLIDPDWQPDAKGIAYAVDKGITDVSGQVEQFVNKHIAKGTLHCDWPRAWMYWCGNFRAFQPRGTGNGSSATAGNGAGILGALKRATGFSGVTVDVDTE